MATSDTTIRHYTESDPDVRLMLRVRDDDAAAFGELVDRHQDRLVSVLTYQVGRRELAEELAQEAFLRVYKARHRYEPGAKFTTWLFTIANNLALNSLRGSARKREVRLAAPSPDQTGAGAPHPAAASSAMPTRIADRTELCDAVQAAIATLSERQRTAVLLAKFENMEYAEIGEVLGLTAKGVKSLLARARENLRQALNPYIERGDAVGSLNDAGGMPTHALGDDE
ncbi:ECF RNA polymerase sigma factor SigW [Botrimarina colliarenosi]|uniref:RNA polymerase sigma factor n=1 Tax=Botrimarina colliarenosi TaxID=2528001 RepID=A0A5C6AC46_9BACT|nr:sigma-70 family RNA polymerase sigma factor [Botrimarina colliarenosi]TWT96705.1 ECF RNA polymerase sigma factor SigW [Botrimarina colliarenosi]